jgi:hypothetical protein
MGLALKIGRQSGETNVMPVKVEYSTYPLLQLLKARYWSHFDPDSEHRRQLETEIQRRCAQMRKAPAADGENGRFRPYGLKFGIIFLFGSIGPFVAVEFLDMIHTITEIDRDHAALSGYWALFTLPVAVIAFLIGGMIDAERVVKWLNLNA